MNEFLISQTIFQNIMYAWMSLAVIIFFLLLKITAPYGRHTTSGWGPMISNKYGWLFMEMPVLIVIGIIILPAYESVSAISLFMLTLFCFHYFNRVFIFPFRLRTKGKKMPLAIVASAVFFNIVNGFSIGYYFTQFANYSNEWITDIRFIGGLVIFLSGMWMNWKATIC